MLKVLIGNESHAEFGSCSLAVLERTRTHISVGLRYGELSHLVLKVWTTKLPEAHVLNSTRHEVSRAAGIEINVFNLVWQWMEQLTDEENFLRSPIKHHYTSIVLFRQPDEKQSFIIVRNLDVKDDGNVWSRDLSKLHLSCHFPDKNVCLRLSRGYKKQPSISTDASSRYFRADSFKTTFLRP